MLQFLMGLWPQIVVIVMGLTTLLGIFLGIRQGGIDAQKSKDQENALKQSEEVNSRITDAQGVGNRVGNDLAREPERLREDDGFKRKYFTKKYGPVIRDNFIPAMEGISESHPLYDKKQDILARLNDLYDNKYKAGLDEINKARSENEKY